MVYTGFYFAASDSLTLRFISISALALKYRSRL